MKQPLFFPSQRFLCKSIAENEAWAKPLAGIDDLLGEAAHYTLFSSAIHFFPTAGLWWVGRSVLGVPASLPEGFHWREQRASFGTREEVPLKGFPQVRTLRPFLAQKRLFSPLRGLVLLKEKDVTRVFVEFLNNKM